MVQRPQDCENELQHRLHILICLADPAAEARKRGISTFLPSPNNQDDDGYGAKAFAGSMVGNGEEVPAVLARLVGPTLRFIREPTVWQRIDAVAAGLIDQSRLTANESRTILESLPPLTWNQQFLEVRHEFRR
ncbi:MAG TPA: hypothetical protein VGP33_16345 [Chloroflexota bacterium]|nr:hypothetical protein [Chloroflexota bacterium]